MDPAFLLTAIIFTPTIGAILLAFANSKATEVLRFTALGATVITFFLTLVLYQEFDTNNGAMQMTFGEGHVGRNQLPSPLVGYGCSQNHAWLRPVYGHESHGPGPRIVVVRSVRLTSSRGYSGVSTRVGRSLRTVSA